MTFHINRITVDYRPVYICSVCDARASGSRCQTHTSSWCVPDIMSLLTKPAHSMPEGWASYGSHFKCPECKT